MLGVFSATSSKAKLTPVPSGTKPYDLFNEQERRKMTYETVQIPVAHDLRGASSVRLHSSQIGGPE